MFSRIVNFYRTGPDKPAISVPPDELSRVYKRRRRNVFLGITIGYGFFYVTRLTFSVVKTPLFREGILTETQAGTGGPAL